MIETVPPALPTQEEHSRYDQIWKRVSPTLEPYPAVRTEPETPPVPLCRAGEEPEWLRGFLRGELADAQTDRCLALLAPTAEGRRLFRRLSSEEAEHAKRLQAAYFLLTGQRYDETVVVPPQPKLPWCDRLRQRYREETCGAARYRSAAAKTADACLKRLFERLSDDELRHAEYLQNHLSRIL